MKKLLVATLLMTSQQSFAICEGSVDPNQLSQCYTTKYIEQEAKMTKLQQAARKVLKKEDMKQLQRATGYWQQYMVEQCEFESRLFADKIALRQATNAMCRYQKIKAQLQLLAQTLQRFSTSGKGAGS